MKHRECSCYNCRRNRASMIGGACSERPTLQTSRARPGQAFSERGSRFCCERYPWGQFNQPSLDCQIHRGEEESGACPAILRKRGVGSVGAALASAPRSGPPAHRACPACPACREVFREQSGRTTKEGGGTVSRKQSRPLRRAAERYLCQTHLNQWKAEEK